MPRYAKTSPAARLAQEESGASGNGHRADCPPGGEFDFFGDGLGDRPGAGAGQIQVAQPSGGRPSGSVPMQGSLLAVGDGVASDAELPCPGDAGLNAIAQPASSVAAPNANQRTPAGSAVNRGIR